MARIPENRAFLVDRTSCLGNPYVLGTDGDRTEVIWKFKRLLWSVMKSHQAGTLSSHDWPGIRMIAGLKTLRAAAREGDIWLVCHCYPEACHSDVIKAAIEWMIEKGME